jgi:nitrogen-specific signal transduction histidine kinase
MKAISTLAGGGAHEFENTLVGITGNMELLKMELPEQ